MWIVVLLFLILSPNAYALFKAEIPGLDQTGVGISGDITIACDDNATLVYDTATASWACGTGGSTSPAGVNTNVQYNDGGSFGADSEFRWNKSNKTLFVGVSSSVAGAVVGTGPNMVISGTAGSGMSALFEDTASSSATGGGTLSLSSHDGGANASGDRLGGYQFGGTRTAGGGTSRGGEIEAFASELWTSTSAGTAIVVSVAPFSSTTRSNHTKFEQDGTLAVMTDDYEALVTHRNDIPNLGYLQDNIPFLPVSKDDLTTQAVSTDMIEASNKPTDGQFLSYNAASLKGKWVTGGGGGDSITVNSSAATDPDFLDGDIDWTLTGGNSITATVGCVGCVDATDLATNSVSSDEVSTQGVSTDKLEASNKPTNGQVYGYNATSLKGKWLSCIDITGSADLCDGSDGGVAGSGVSADVIFMSSQGSGAAATRFTPVYGFTSSATEGDADNFIVPQTCSMDRFVAQIDNEPGGVGRSWDVTLRFAPSNDNLMVNSSLTCNIANGKHRCENVTAKQGLPQGASVDVVWTRNSTANSPGNLSASWRCIT